MKIVQFTESAADPEMDGTKLRIRDTVLKWHRYISICKMYAAFCAKRIVNTENSEVKR
jgi:hypothetical protein